MGCAAIAAASTLNGAGMTESDKPSGPGPTDQNDSAGASPAAASGNGGPQAAAPRIVTKRGQRISWIWLVPLVVALVGVSLIAKKWMDTGPIITISFESAEGLEVGQTKIRYKNVDRKSTSLNSSTNENHVCRLLLE